MIKLGYCVICKNELFGKKYRLGVQKYCSSICFGKSILKPRTLKCKFCQNELLADIRVRQKYCNNICSKKALIGRIVSEETRRKISDANKIAYKNDELRKTISNRQKGLNNSGRLSIMGEKNPLWKGGITPINQKFMGI